MAGRGQYFRRALQEEQPLQIAGAVNAFSALLAERAGFQALYLSGAGVANVSYGLPDLGMTTLDSVLQDAHRIIAAVDLPLLVDCDTGWGSDLMVGRTVDCMARAGVAAIHLEDQGFHKRCGHRPNKTLVSVDEMCARLRAADHARQKHDIFLIARTDALAVEGVDAALERALAYQSVGVDALFLEAAESFDVYRQFSRVLDIPLLANMTEFGKTPLADTRSLGDHGVKMVLYPLSAQRAMAHAAEEVYRAIRSEGSQQTVLSQMQTREELYEVLNYHRFEQQLNSLEELDA